jgi:hypothetical protein
MASSIARKKVQNLGVPPGGTSNQVLAKSSGDDYDINWVTGGGGGSPTDLSYNASTRVVASSTGTDATLTLADGTNPGLLASADFTKLSNTSGTNTGDNATNTQYSGLAASKQDTLVSGTNIKTINSNSLLGSGNLVVAASVIDGNYTAIQVSSSGTVWDINAATVGITQLSASGTPSGTTFLRGDNTWVAPFSGLAKITVGTSTPGSPSVGDLWIDTN